MVIYDKLRENALSIYKTESELERAHSMAMYIMKTSSDHEKIKDLADEIEKYFSSRTTGNYYEMIEFLKKRKNWIK